ncbi:hypothetical protein H310_05499 [Aphanomyces invadans]|uniref:Uncharacterized protein n=1 Tax=Aphanomyces invadans TaxID=157072 RepID=A0A024U9H0_9STRA|nr:hypothetical protein H310_05499 [Aphanomyces invadans]ETW03071.1 hypothetical protein H310_05499 [Aphanomyces invadans]RHY34411.1 hypothetical protein DYB32_000967 [Aphanomyces invadans]|eukprot:XP_008868455.1 hypothetical protein H310_05499 [Aphanomyces invadans]
MERLARLLVAGLAPLSAASDSMSSTDAAQLLNGRGPATFAYSSSTGINIDTLLDNFPACDNKCVGTTPCGSTSILTAFGSSSCVATTKSKSPSCPNAYVCCDPATCRAKTQSHCTYGTSHVVDDLNELSYKSALQYLAFIGGDMPVPRNPIDVEAVFNVLEKPLDAAVNSKRCESQCNGWNGIWGCPTSCDCVNSPVPPLTVGEKYRCVGTGYGASGYASPASKLANGTVVCPSGYACDDSVTSTTPCIGQPIRTTTGAPAYLSPSQSSAQNVNGSDQTTAIAVGSACGALGLVGAGAMYFMYRKKKKHEDDEHAASVLASLSSDHYHEAPNGA